MRYQEFKPHSTLEPYVQCFWSSQEGTPAAFSDEKRIVPLDGSLDLIFRYDLSRGETICVTPFVSGIMTTPLALAGADGERGWLGVRFRPGCARAFISVPICDTADTNIPAEAIFSAEVNFLAEQLAPCDLRTGIALVECFLGRRLPSAPQPDPLVLAAVQQLQSGVDNIAALTDHLGVSRQYLARKFKTEVGLSPKSLARIARVEIVRHMARTQRFPDWCQVAQRCGYFDQSHLILDFKSVMGQTPTEWHAARSARG